MSNHPEPGTYAVQLTRGRIEGRPCLFLDRDGVIVEETNYLHQVADVRFIPGVAQAVARVNQAGLAVVMVTNQAGIGRGYYGWNEFSSVQAHIYERFAAHGAHFDLVLACAYHEAGLSEYAVSGHPWRKPNPGMLLHAAQSLQLDLSRSLIVGDCVTDLLAGQAAGLRTGSIVLTGHGRREREALDDAQMAAWRAAGFDASIHSDAAAAVSAWHP